MFSERDFLVQVNIIWFTDDTQPVTLVRLNYKMSTIKFCTAVSWITYFTNCSRFKEGVVVRGENFSCIDRIDFNN